jgi:hypothetical protein
MNGQSYGVRMARHRLTQWAGVAIYHHERTGLAASRDYVRGGAYGGPWAAASTKGRR